MPPSTTTTKVITTWSKPIEVRIGVRGATSARREGDGRALEGEDAHVDARDPQAPERRQPRVLGHHPDRGAEPAAVQAR